MTGAGFSADTKEPRAYRQPRRSRAILGEPAEHVSAVFVDLFLAPAPAPLEALLARLRIALRHALRLDQPLGSQYVAFVHDVLDGSLGHSFRQRDRAVSALVNDVLPHTARLALVSMLIGLVVANAFKPGARLQAGAVGVG